MTLKRNLAKLITNNNDEFNVPLMSYYMCEYDEFPSYYESQNFYDWEKVIEYIFRQYNIDSNTIPAYRVLNGEGKIEYSQLVCTLKPKLILCIVNQTGVTNITSIEREMQPWEDEIYDLDSNCRKLCFAYAYDHNIINFQEIIDLEALLKPFKMKPTKKGQINIVAKNQEDGLHLKEFKVKTTSMDLGLSYGSGFLETHNIIIKALTAEDQSKGLVLLHGKPGTGKSYYIRNLINSIGNKKIIYLTPDLAAMISDPSFITFLLDFPNSILVIEDGENIIRSREFGANQAVANLLNLADGLLADALNMQIICTFNCDLTDVDSALLRKGRLIAQHNFSLLTKEEAQKMSDSLGYDVKIEKEMSLADIYNHHEKNFSSKTKQKTIGFGN